MSSSAIPKFLILNSVLYIDYSLIGSFRSAPSSQPGTYNLYNLISASVGDLSENSAPKRVKIDASGDESKGKESGPAALQVSLDHLNVPSDHGILYARTSFE